MRAYTLLLFAVLLSCDDDSPAGKAPPTPAEIEQRVKAEVEEEKKRLGLDTDSDFPDPCGFVTAAEVRVLAQVPRTSMINAAPGHVAKNLCAYTWEKPNAEALRAANAEAQRKAMMAAMKDITKKGAKPSETIMDAVNQGEPPTGSVSISVPQFRINDPAHAKQTYEATLKRMEKGISRTATTKTGDHTVTLQRSYEPVEGVGDAAAWSAKARQLAVRSGATVLYVDVHVTNDDAANFALAKKVALKAIE